MYKKNQSYEEGRIAGLQEAVNKITSLYNDYSAHSTLMRIRREIQELADKRRLELFNDIVQKEE